MKKLITLLALAFCLNANAQCPITLTGYHGFGTNSFYVCTGGTTTVSAIGASSYTWMPSCVNTTSVALSPTVTTTYTITGTTGTCTATNTFTINVIAASTPSIPTLTSPGYNPISVCQGSALTLSVTPAANSFPILYNGANYIEYGNTTALTYTAPTNVVGTTIYNVYDTSTSAFCVSAPLTITVTVNAVPSAPVFSGSNPVTLCQGTSTTLSVSPTGTITSAPVWYNDVIGTQVAAGNTYMPSTTTIGTTIFTVIDSSVTFPPTGCTSAATGSILTITVTVNAVPSISLIVGNSTICAGGASTLMASGASIYTWIPGGATTSSITVTPSVTTIYTVTGASGSCSSMDVIQIVVNPTPTITINPSTIAICAGSSATLTASGASSYFWLPSATLSSNTGSSVVATPTSITTYTVNGSDGATGCINTPSNAGLITINVTPSPSVTYTLVADTAPHTWDAYPTYPGGAITVLWSWGDGTTSSSLYPSHTYSVAGTYSICVTVTEGGCATTYCQNDAVSRLANNNSTLSTMVYINVKSGTMGIEQFANSNELNIYPNPNNGSFVIEPSSATKQTMQVYDVNGKLVLSQTINGKTTIDASSLAEGVVNKRMVIVK